MPDTAAVELNTLAMLRQKTGRTAFLYEVGAGNYKVTLHHHLTRRPVPLLLTLHRPLISMFGLGFYLSFWPSYDSYWTLSYFETILTTSLPIESDWILFCFRFNRIESYSSKDFFISEANHYVKIRRSRWISGWMNRLIFRLLTIGFKLHKL
jgi:hypothetical protein